MGTRTIYQHLYRRPFDWFWRMWFGSQVTNHNGEQCPRCRGTDKSRYLYEGFCTGDRLKCERCDKEWWN